MPLISPRPPRKFKNLDEKWRNCYYCGQAEATQSDIGTILGGRMWPESELVEYQGRWYCIEHFNWRFTPKFRDETKFDIKDGDTSE